MSAFDPHSLTGAYALDALDAEEASGFEAHLESCAACRAEVRDFQEVAGMLALCAESPPPRGLFERVVRRARDVRDDAEGDRDD